MKQLTSIEADLEQHLELLENKVAETEQSYLEHSFGGSVATEFSLAVGDGRNVTRRSGISHKEKIFSSSSCSDEVIERAAGAAEMLTTERDAVDGGDDDDDEEDWNGKGRKRKSSRRRGGRDMDDDED